MVWLKRKPVKRFLRELAVDNRFFVQRESKESKTWLKVGRDGRTALAIARKKPPCGGAQGHVGGAATSQGTVRSGPERWGQIAIPNIFCIGIAGIGNVTGAGIGKVSCGWNPANGSLRGRLQGAPTPFPSPRREERRDRTAFVTSGVSGSCRRCLSCAPGSGGRWLRRGPRPARGCGQSRPGRPSGGSSRS